MFFFKNFYVLEHKKKIKKLKNETYQKKKNDLVILFVFFQISTNQQRKGKKKT